MSGGELKYIREAFNQNWVAPLGPNVDNFEKALSKYTGVEHVTALNSGTSAIHMALILLGVKPQDEVVASTFTFSATINPILYIGAKPILVDSEPETWNMDPELLEAAIKDRIARFRKPKAIILVHLYGMPAKIYEIMKIADMYDIPVIEDTAEALGSRFCEKHVGSFGKMAILSFNGNKIINNGALRISNDHFNSSINLLKIVGQAGERSGRSNPTYNRINFAFELTENLRTGGGFMGQRIGGISKLIDVKGIRYLSGYPFGHILVIFGMPFIYIRAGYNNFCSHGF